MILNLPPTAFSDFEMVSAVPRSSNNVDELELEFGAQYVRQLADKEAMKDCFNGLDLSPLPLDEYQALAHATFNKMKARQEISGPSTGYESQMPDEVSNFIKPVLLSLGNAAGKSLSDSAFSKCHAIFDLLYLILRAEDWSIAVISIDMFLTLKGVDSVALLLEFIKGKKSAQSGEEDSARGSEESNGETADDPDSPPPVNSTWREFVDNIRNNWSVVRFNPFFRYLSKLLGVLVALEISDAKDTKISIKGLKVVAPEIAVVQGDAFDVMEAILDTVDYMIRTYAVCSAKNSLEPLFFSDDEARELDVEYATLLSLWPLVQNGNLVREKDMSEETFNRRLNDLAGKLRRLVPSVWGSAKQSVEHKYLETLKLLNDYSVLRTSSGLKFDPFVVEYYGRSNQGKSFVCNVLTNILLESQQLPTDDKYKWTCNASDKFMSGVDSTKQVALLDDFANGKAQHATGNPCQTLIEIANPTGFTPNMAALHEKGKISPRFQIINITTNKKDLAAHQYSECPMSIQRRPHVVITVSVKDELQAKDNANNGIGIDTAKALAHNKDSDTFDDNWNFTLERAGNVQDLSAVAPYEVIVHNGKQMRNISWMELMNYMIEKFDKHRKDQDEICKRTAKTKKLVKRCPHENCIYMSGMCPVHKGLKPQFGIEVAQVLNARRKTFVSRMQQYVFGLDSMATTASIAVITAAADTFEKHWDWMWFVPTPWIQNELFMSLMTLLHKDHLTTKFKWHTTFIWSFFAACAGPAFYDHGFDAWLSILVLLLLAIMAQKTMVKGVISAFQLELAERATICDSLQTIRDEHMEQVLRASAVLAFFYGIAYVYRANRDIVGEIMQPQGNLEPKTLEDVKKRDSEVNVWTEVVRRPLPLQDLAKGSTPAQLARLINNNLVYASVDVRGKPHAANILFLDTGVVVIPQHYFLAGGDDLKVICRRKDPKASGGTFTLMLGISNAYFVPDSDIALVAVSGGGDFSNLTKYLPEGLPTLTDFKWTYRLPSGEIQEAKGLAEYTKTGHDLKHFKGLEYKSLTIHTKGGDCGAVLTAVHKSLILGFHVGGKENTSEGCACVIQLCDIERFREKQVDSPDTVNSGSSTQFQPHMYGIKFLLNGEPHKKSPVRYMPENSQIRWLGNCTGHATFKTDCKVTLISEHVMKYMDSPNVYRGPVESPQWQGWQKCLANLAAPADPFPVSLLQNAVNDYKQPLLELFKSKLWNDTKPLTDLENMNGIPGKKFMDRIKLNTAVGFPLTGQKDRYVNELEPVEPYTKVVEFTPLVRDEIERVLEKYKSGLRAYVVAKACKKDEILSKDKNRIFYANSAPLTYLVRKYFLPLIRVFQMNPLTAECAVGVNSHGPEWERLHQFLHHYGEDRIFGGDYSKYDQKLPSQLLLAAFKILIDCAKTLPGYNEEDLRVMETMTADIVYSIIAFNGDLIALTNGGHISGNSLTVILNGICGSLNLRCCFYSKYPVTMRFRDNVNLLTYGDDNGGCVRPGIEFGTLTISKFLGEYNQTYTRPDKKEATSEFLEPEIFDFIKRKSVFIPEIGVHVGALDEGSCTKMLHCYLRNSKSVLSEELACAINIDTAAREWFNHGRDVYENRRCQLQKIAKAAEIDHLCSDLNLTFDDRVENWKAKYDPDP